MSMEADAAKKLTEAHDFFYVADAEKKAAAARNPIKVGRAVEGYDFNQGIDWEKLVDQYGAMGFQGSSLGHAIDEINKMLKWRLSDEPWTEDQDDDLKDPEARAKVKCTIFLGYTSNMISCGSRELIRFLCQHKMIDCIVTTGGGIEEDFIKCFAPTFVGDFALKGADLRAQGLNRIGNLLIANENYVQFEEWVVPILDQMLAEQKANGTIWTPSKIINRLGQEINDERSVYYWCWKNDIPVFCPAITDGSLGDMIYFQSYSNPGFIVDIAQDIRLINNRAVVAKKSGMIILGGGVVKHHICNANLLRNGADFSVFINTGQEFDGSDSGARPDEAVSWGKIKLSATPVKIYAEISLVLPIIVAKTFARQYWEDKRKEQQQQQQVTKET